MHVPGWHEATKKLQEEGKVQMIGIIQEQHPDRARLFMQWKRMGWPILVDSFNLLNVAAVPITLAIDEDGIIRARGLSVKAASRIEEDFVNRTYERPQSALPAVPPDLAKLKLLTRKIGAQSREEYATALALWGGMNRTSEVIENYQEALRTDPESGPLHFRLGVAYRMRYDSEHRRINDFAKAIEHWAKALEIDPNQYIWRRRIQQYGPRLDKPYPFYDWVAKAREEIRKHGETPVPLPVEPTGAELAQPAKTFEISPAARPEPDPQGRVRRDKERLIMIETVAVPPSIVPGGAARLHVIFRTNPAVKAHWNNEAEGLVFWLEPQKELMVERSYISLPNPPQEVSQETRIVEFEIRCPPDAKPGTFKLSGYALYYGCEDVNGTCLYRRQDVAINLIVR
jgi:tetratricopeptide (TPR) repeat protein